MCDWRKPFFHGIVWIHAIYLSRYRTSPFESVSGVPNYLNQNLNVNCTNVFNSFSNGLRVYSKEFSNYFKRIIKQFVDKNFLYHNKIGIE